MRFLVLRLFLNAFGLVLADSLLDGIQFDTPWAVLSASIMVGVVNALIRPVLFILTLPLTVVTLGLFTVVLNAFLLLIVDWSVAGFHIYAFRSAMACALILSLVSFIGSRFLTEPVPPHAQA